MSMCMRMVVKSLIVVSTALVWAGCGGGETKVQEVSMNDLPERAAEVYCKKMFNCCSSAERTGIVDPASDTDVSSEQNCRSTYSGQIASNSPPINNAIESGRLVYDAQAMGKCLSKFQGRHAASFPGTEC